MLATYMQCMHNKNLVIRIAGSSCSRKKQDYLDQPDHAPNLRRPRWPAPFFQANALIKECKKRFPAVNITIKLTNGLTKVASIVTLGWILQRAFCKRKILTANINTFLLNTLRNEETWWWRPSQIITFVKFCSSICCVLFSSCSKNR